jgi:phosphatidylserine/phosphatidylglycerophosphate/cardiolipin synthase-like enzyme
MSSSGKGFSHCLGVFFTVSALTLSFALSNSSEAKTASVGESSVSVEAAKAKPKPKPTKPISAPPAVGEPSNPIQGNVTLDTCFSPGNCDQKLIRLIGTATRTLEVAIYSLTHTGISQAIIDAKNRGVQVRLVVDRSQSKGKSSQVDALETAGIDLKIGNFKGIMHDKYTIVDETQMETGSFNYSENATVNNGENQLYLNDASVIKRYEDNFNAMYKDGLAK